MCLSNLSRSSPLQKNLYEHWDELANDEFFFFGSPAIGEAQDSAYSFGLVPVGALCNDHPDRIRGRAFHLEHAARPSYDSRRRPDPHPGRTWSQRGACLQRANSERGLYPQNLHRMEHQDVDINTAIGRVSRISQPTKNENFLISYSRTLSGRTANCWPNTSAVAYR